LWVIALKGIQRLKTQRLIGHREKEIGAHDSVLSVTLCFKKDFVRDLYPRLLPTKIPGEQK